MMSMVKHILKAGFVLGLLGLGQTVHAEDESPSWPDRSDFAWYFTVGGQRMQIKALNDRLQAQQYTLLGDTFLSFGGGAHVVIDGVMVELDGYGLLSNNVLGATHQAIVTAGAMFLNLGYATFPLPNLKVYPLFGLGAGGMNLHFLERGASPTFDEILQKPGRMSDISSLAFLLNLGLGIDYHFPLDTFFSPRLGFRVGYVISPVQSSFWDMNTGENNSRSIPGGPSAGMDGPYIRLLLGF